MGRGLGFRSQSLVRRRRSGGLVSGFCETPLGDRGGGLLPLGVNDARPAGPEPVGAGRKPAAPLGNTMKGRKTNDEQGIQRGADCGGRRSEGGGILAGEDRPPGRPGLRPGRFGGLAGRMAVYGRAGRPLRRSPPRSGEGLAVAEGLGIPGRSRLLPGRRPLRPRLVGVAAGRMGSRGQRGARRGTIRGGSAGVLGRATLRRERAFLLAGGLETGKRRPRTVSLRVSEWDGGRRRERVGLRARTPIARREEESERRW